MLRRWSAVVFACLVLLALLVIAYRTGNGIRDRVSRDPATTRDLPFSSDAVPALQPPASDGGVGVVSDLGPREVTIAGSVEVGAVGSRPRTCFVRAVDAETLKAIAEVAANADGRFEASFPTAATGSSVVVLVANGSEGAHHWVSHPRPVVIAPDVTAYFVTLKLLSGCRISAHVVDDAGRPVSGAICLLTQLSLSTLGRKVPSTEIDALRTLDEYVSANSSGELSAIVREGHFELRASADGRTYGVPVRLLAPAFGQLDVGAIRVPSNVVTLALRVTGPDGRPLEGMWVRLGDRTLRFGSPRQGGEVAHLLTDGAGRVAFTMDAALLPLRGAVGSREFGCREIVWTERMPNAELELAPRPHVDLVVRSPSGEVVPIEVDWFVEGLDGREPAVPETRSPLDVLRMHCDVHDRRQTRPGTCRITLASPGRFRFSAELPGGHLLAAEALVAGGDAEIPVVLEGVRRLTLLLRNMPARDVVIDVHALQGPTDATPFTSKVVAPSEADQAVCWIPETIDDVTLDCYEFSRQWVFAGVRSLSQLEIDVASVDSNCTLRFEARPNAGREAFLVRLPTGKICRIASDREGVAQLRLKPGAYEVAEVTAGGTPSWQRFVVGEAGRMTVTVRPSH